MAVVRITFLRGEDDAKDGWGRVEMIFPTKSEQWLRCLDRQACCFLRLSRMPASNGALDFLANLLGG